MIDTKASDLLNIAIDAWGERKRDDPDCDAGWTFGPYAEAYLNQQGYRIVRATDVEQAIECAERELSIYQVRMNFAEYPDDQKRIAAHMPPIEALISRLCTSLTGAINE